MILTTGQLILLVVLFFLASFFLSMIGLGGGVLYIPILTILFKVPVQIAIGISLFCMTFSTLSATIGFWSKKCVNWQLALAYDVFDIPGIILGAWLTTVLPGFILEIFCGIAVCIIGYMTLRKKTTEKPVCESPYPEVLENKDNNPAQNAKNSNSPIQNQTPSKINFKYAWSGKNLKWVLFSSFFGGLVTGMVGLGGGTVDTTTMILIGVPMHMAAGSSTLAMFFTNAIGVTTHILLGNIIWDFAIPTGITVLIAGFLGARYASKVNANILQKGIGVVAIITGIRLMFSSF
jgi:uncharacterized membrane protein YfcA